MHRIGIVLRGRSAGFIVQGTLVLYPIRAKMVHNVGK